MTNIVGLPPRITDEKAAIILEWHRNRRTFDDWARILGVSSNTVKESIAAYASPEQWNFLNRRVDGVGRRRLLATEQMQVLVSWYRARKTRAELARELGLSVWQVMAVVKRGRAYVQRRRDEDILAGFAVCRSKLKLAEICSCPTGPAECRHASLRQLRAENAARFRAWLVVDNA